MNHWFLLRVALILAGSVAAFFAPLEQRAQPPIDWQALLQLLLFAPVGLFLVIGIQAVNPWSAKVWRRPSWSINPFSFSEPLQFFHFAGYFLLAQGLVVALRVAASKPQLHAEGLVPLAMGGGCLIGLQLALLAFRFKLHRGA